MSPPLGRRLTKASMVCARASVRTSLWSPPARSRCVDWSRLSLAAPGLLASVMGLLSGAAPGSRV